MSNLSKANTIDDVDDDLFASRPQKNYIFAEKKAQDVQQRTTRSLLNTRSLIEESERVGQSSLEQLSSQRESLERVENDLDSINTMTRTTQKHLNNMKSFFGGFKSLFSSSNQNQANQIAQPVTRSGMPRSATLATMPSNNSSSQQQQQKSAIRQPSTSIATVSALEKPRVAEPLENPSDEFEANLSEIGFGIGRLREMAMKLGDEIGDQNDMLDRITDKSERAGDSIKHQNRQMNQLLKKS